MDFSLSHIWYGETSADNIRVNIYPAQQQGNVIDCSLFPIAFAVTLAFGNKPEVISYDEGNLLTFKTEEI